MVTSELLRRYPFFGVLSDVQLKALSMLADKKNFESGAIIFEECDIADKLYLLIEGNVDLSYRSMDEGHAYASPPKEFYAGSINPGEVFGISALIEPYKNNATAKVSVPSHAIVFDAI